MQVWLDIAGSVIIAGFIILIMAGLNLNMINSSSENLYTNIAQENICTSAEIMEYDLYKIGYRITGNKIVTADSNEIKYYLDADNDGSSDSIRYYLSDVSELSTTANPNDKILYKKLNTGTETNMGIVTDFILSYFDSSATELSYASLLNQTYRNKIRTIEVYLKIESIDPVDSVYQAGEWIEKIYPKNL